ncbi:MAG: hypothetical protein HY718_12270 [Planctomycetes bacterium]|nr:hypothetical protein [Planctomycetota bacterium]
MTRWWLAVVCGVGWLVLAGAVVAPLVGTVWAVTDPAHVATQVVHTPNAGALARRSLTLSATATGGAMLLGILPAAVLGACSRRAWPWLLGLVLAPLIVPPQVYAYGWGLVQPGIVGPWTGASPEGRQTASAIRAGLISAGWLWPVVSLVIAAGWRSTGQLVYRLAVLDASPLRAFVRAVLPSLRSHLVAAACLVMGITLIEYAIPHLTLCRVWATELMVLVEIAAPAGQIVRMAVQPAVVVAGLAAVVTWTIRGTGGWQAISDEETTPDRTARLKRRGSGFGTRGSGFFTRAPSPEPRAPLPRPWLVAWVGAGVIWVATLGLPLVAMLANLRVPGAWASGLATFSGQWADSLQVAAGTGLAAVALALGTVGWFKASRRRLPQWGGIASLLAAIVPPPAMGIGFVLVFNRGGLIGEVYTQTPMVWILALVGRYGAVAVLIAWLAVGRRDIAAMDQARVDGGTSLDILGHVLLPLIWPSLLAAGSIVAVLAVFEVVVTQMTAPPAYGSIAMTVLNYMHYGRDDAVITSSVTLMAAGVLLTAVCGRVLARVGK